MARSSMTAREIDHTDISGDEWHDLLAHMRALLDGKAPESDADRAALAILQPPDDNKRGGR